MKQNKKEIMKKIFMAIALCLMCTTSFGQATWDEIGKALKGTTTYTFGKTTYIGTLDIISDTITETLYIYWDTINGGYLYEKEFYKNHPEGFEFSHKKSVTKRIPIDTSFIQISTIPTCIYNRYKLGEQLTIAGWVNFGFGTCIAAVGGILLADQHVSTTKAGIALLGVGGALITISIPQLCFGDNIKRESNTLLQIYDQLQYKPNYE